MIFKKLWVLWIEFYAIYWNYKFSVLRVKYKCIILISSVGGCVVVTTKISYSILVQVATQFFHNWKSFKKSRKCLEKHDRRVEVFIDKFVKIWSFSKKLHIFGKRKLGCIFLCKKLNSLGGTLKIWLIHVAFDSKHIRRFLSNKDEMRRMICFESFLFKLTLTLH